MSDFPILDKFRLFVKGRKNIKLLECEQIIYHFKARDLDICIYSLFRKIFGFHENTDILEILRNLLLLIF